jgi:DNA-binding transcriptional regulator of glucitol operon
VAAAGTLGGVPRVFLTPKWLLRHALALVLVAACLRLGWWQLDEARRTGDVQNLGYTLEWPFFALAVVFVWVRLMQWEINPPKKGARLSRPLHTAPAVKTPAAPRPAPPRDETDERLDRYNAYLARLAAEEERR